MSGRDDLEKLVAFVIDEHVHRTRIMSPGTLLCGCGEMVIDHEGDYVAGIGSGYTKHIAAAVAARVVRSFVIGRVTEKEAFGKEVAHDGSSTGDSP